MTQTEINKGNYSISKFKEWIESKPNIFQVPNLYPIYEMDAEENTGWTETSVDDMLFHKSWDWLMPVVEKICRLKDENPEHVQYSYPRTFGMLNQETGEIMVRLDGLFLHQSDTLIQATYEAVVEFTESYNKHK